MLQVLFFKDIGRKGESNTVGSFNLLQNAQKNNHYFYILIWFVLCYGIEKFHLM